MFRRTRKTSDFSSEIEAHLQLEAERLREQGLNEEDARTAARRFDPTVLERDLQQNRLDLGDLHG